MSAAFYNNPRFQQQRPQPNSATVQRLLDENASLIQTIIEYQKRGSLAEVYEYEQLLHRNLVYLTQLAEPTVNSQHALPPPQAPPGGGMVNGSSGSTVRMPNVTLGQLSSAGQRQPQPSQQVQPLGVPGSTMASQQQQQQQQHHQQQPQSQQQMAQQQMQQPPQPQQQSQPPMSAPQQQSQQSHPPPPATPPQMQYRPGPGQPGSMPPGPYGQPPQQYPGGPQMVMARQPMQHGAGPMPPMGMSANPHAGAAQGMMRHQQPHYNQPPGAMYQPGPPNVGSMMSVGGMGMQQMMAPGAQQGAPQQMSVPPGYQPNYGGQ